MAMSPGPTGPVPGGCGLARLPQRPSRAVIGPAFEVWAPASPANVTRDAEFDRRHDEAYTQVTTSQSIGAQISSCPY